MSSRTLPTGDLPPDTPGAWRLLRQLVATLRQAIFPQPTITRLQHCAKALRRHLHEPPRRRSYQSYFSAYGTSPGDGLIAAWTASGMEAA